MSTEVLVGIGGLIAAMTAALGAIVAFSKRKPEMASVLVQSASELVVTQGTVLRDTAEALARTEDRLGELESRSIEHERIQTVARVEIEELHRELAQMHDEVAALTNSRNEAEEALQEEKRERRRLQKRVSLLEDTLRAHNIEVPEPDAPSPFSSGQDTMSREDEPSGPPASS